MFAESEVDQDTQETLLHDFCYVFTSPKLIENHQDVARKKRPVSKFGIALLMVENWRGRCIHGPNNERLDWKTAALTSMAPTNESSDSTVLMIESL